MNLKSILGVVLLAAGALGGPIFHLPAAALSIFSSIGVAVGGIGVRQMMDNNAPVVSMIAAGNWKTITGALAILVSIALSPDLLNQLSPYWSGIVQAAAQLLMAIGLVHGVAKTNTPRAAGS